MRLVLALVIAVGCGGEKESGKGEDRTEDTGDRTREAEKTRREPTALGEAEVVELVEKWKGAQNQGDFAGYQALYAKRMTGIKRVGPRVFTFDRAGWMKDRGRMFKKKMEVAAGGVKVSPGGQSALVRLQQTFKQGSFQDVGPKELVVVREEGGLRIAREEMLASAVVGGKGAAAAALADFYFILDGEVLLEPTTGASPKGTTTLVKEAGSASFRARAAVDSSELDGPAAALAGKKLTVYGPDGMLCHTQLGKVTLVTGLTPHFGTAAVWRGEDGSTPLGDDEIAGEVWSGGRTVLVGDAGTCKAGLFARASAPVVAFEPVDDTALAGKVKAAYRKLPEWEATQKSFAETGGQGSWDEGDEAAVEVAIFRHPTAGKTWAVVHARGGNPCSEFGAEMTIVFEQAGAAWKNRSGLHLEPFRPAAAFDLDGDGDPELLAPLRLVADTGDGFSTVLEFSYPDHDCPC